MNRHHAAHYAIAAALAIAVGLLAYGLRNEESNLVKVDKAAGHFGFSQSVPQ